MVDQIQVNTTQYSLLMYYGNNSATAVSDQNTFKLLRGVVGYWTSNDTSGATLADSSPQANNGTLDIGASGTQTTTTQAWTNGASGKYASSINLDGTDDKVTISTSAAQLTTGMTISTWIRPTAGGSTQNIVDNSNAWSYRFYRNGTTLSLQLSTNGANNGYHSAANALTAGAWQHIVAVFNGSNIIFYVNGAQVLSEAAGTATIQSPSAGWILGSYGTGEYYNGSLDDTRIYNRALTNSEITALYQNPGTIASISPSISRPTISFSSEEQSEGPVAYWKFENNLEDSTTNNNDALPVINSSAKQKYAEGIQGKAIDFTTDEWGTTLTWVNSTTVQDATKSWTTNQWAGYEFITDYTPGNTYCRHYITANTATQLTLSGSCTTWTGAKTYRIKKTLYIRRQVNYGTQNVTASVWFKRMASKADTSNTIFRTFGNDIAIEAHGSYISGYVINYTNSFNCSIDGNDNQWHHVAITYDGTTARLYYDGKECNTKAQTGTLDNNEYVVIGSRNDGFSSFFEGYIDELKIYSYTRTQQQIKNDYNSSAAVVLGAKDSSNLTKGLAGHWKMDEAPTATVSAQDSSGNGNTGVASGTLSTTGKYGSARNFNGLDDHLNAGTAINIADSSFTISAWAKRNSTNTYDIIYANGPSAAAAGKNIHFGFRSNNTFTLAFYGGDDVNTISTYTDSNWHHWVGTYDTTTKEQRLYQDGILVASRIANANFSGTGTSYIGTVIWSNNPASTYFDGSLDDVRVYDRSLSQSEIQQLYYFAPPPVAYYDFENSTNTTLYDRSGNNKNGTWNGTGSRYDTGKFGKAGRFNGVDDWVNIGALGITSDSTVEAWVYAEDTGTTGAYGIMGNSQATRLTWSGTTFQYFINNSAWTPTYRYVNQTGTSQKNRWYHVAGVRDSQAGTLKIYIDGILSNTTTGTPIDLVNDLGWTIVRRDSNSGFKGMIDEVRVYNYPRTPGQIVEDMNAGHPIGGSPIGSQALYLKMDEGTGTTAYDTSSNKLNGTITSCTWTNNAKSGKGLNCDGGGYISLGNQTPLQSSDFTISTWIKAGTINVSAANANGNIIMGKESYTISGFRSGISNTGNINFWATQSGGTLSLSSAATISDGQWHHAVVTYDSASSTGKIYLDGKLSDSETGTYIPNTSAGFSINAGVGGTTRSNSSFDEFKYYTTALTAEQIKLDYNSGQSNQFGVLGTEADGTPSNSTDRMYCPPGDTTTSCSPVGEWKFDEKYGTSARDTSGNNNSGTLTSGPSWSSGKIGSALSFDGTNDYVNVPDSSSLQMSSNISVSLWVNPNSLNNQIVNYPISKGSGASVGNGWAFGITGTWGTCPSNQFYLYTNNGQICSGSGNTIPLNTWSHITFTNDGATTKLYLNGKLINSGTQTLESTIGLALNIGRRSDGNWAFNGKIDQIQIYNYALSPSQIAWSYNRGAPIAHYKLNECQGSTVHSSILPYNSLLNGTINVGASGTQTNVGTCQTSGAAWGNGDTGKFGGSLNFDGTDDNIDFGDYNLIEQSTVTFTSWIKLNSTNTDDDIFTKGAHNQFQPVLIWRDDIVGAGSDLGNTDTLSVIIYDGTTQDWYAAPSGSLNDTNWHHIAISIVPASQIKIYIDGVLLRTGSMNSTGILNSANPFKIGHDMNAGAGAFGGQIDDIQIFNYELTAQQIKTVMNQGAIRFGP